MFPDRSEPVRQTKAALELHDLTTPRPLADWCEEIGPVLWWTFHLQELPYVGTPLDMGHTVELWAEDAAGGSRMASRTRIGGWPGHHTHWTPLPRVCAA